MHTRLHQGPSRREDSHADLERLGLADGVVDDVDRARVGHRQALQRLAQPTAAPGDELLDQRQARFGRQHLRGAESIGQLSLRSEAGHHRQLDVQVQRCQDRHRTRRASRLRTPAPGPTAVADDG